MTLGSSRHGRASGDYVLLTVIFASVLFFAGIACKFQSRQIDLAMLIRG